MILFNLSPQERAGHPGQQRDLEDREQRQRYHLLRLHGQLHPVHHLGGHLVHREAGITRLNILGF